MTWIDVKEELPEISDEEFLVTDGDFVMTATFDQEGWFNEDWPGFRANITHWMTLPELPKEKQHELD